MLGVGLYFGVDVIAPASDLGGFCHRSTLSYRNVDCRCVSAELASHAALSVIIKCQIEDTSRLIQVLIEVFEGGTAASVDHVLSSFMQARRLKVTGIFDLTVGVIDDLPRGKTVQSEPRNRFLRRKRNDSLP